VSEPATLKEKLRLLLVRERELHGLRQEYSGYRAWMEKVQTITLRLADHEDGDRALARLVRALVDDFAFEYAAAVADRTRTSAGVALEDPGDLALVDRAVAAVRDHDAPEVVAEDVPEDSPRRLAWLLAARAGGRGGRPFVLLVGRSPRAAAFHPPPWDRELERFRHLRDTVAHAVAAVDYRAALVAERNNLQAEVERATAELTGALAMAEAARREAQEASRAKSAFLANMSHELRTPMNAVLGYGELVLEQSEELGAAALADDARRLQIAGTHLSKLIDEVLDLSKIEARRMDLALERFALVPLVEQTLEIVRPLAAERGDRLELEVVDDPGEIQADPAKLRQVLVNLLSNACKFTRDGRVRVHVATAVGEAGRPEVVLAVSDTGVGMSEDQIDRLFDPYRQVHDGGDDVPQGTGLGLVISRKFCRLMGGDLTAHARPGEGSTFVVHLPRTVEPLR
jgi:signal transduction histidine kinase